MPNWCYNVIQISGPTKDMDKFVGASNNYPDTIANILDKYAPLPGGEWDYSLAVENWSTKWDFDLHILHAEWSPAGHCIVEGNFETAWAPATDGWQKIATKFPTLKFVINFIEEGMGFYGYDIYRDGKHVDEMGADIPDDVDGDNFDEQYQSLHEFFDIFTDETRFANSFTSAVHLSTLKDGE